jgi:hypothetical protein
MALSNWDSLEKFAGDDELVNMLRKTISIYKNSLHISPWDSRTMYFNRNYREGVKGISKIAWHVGEEEDKVRIHIEILDGSQDGIFFCVEATNYEKKIHAYGAGCGVSGYSEEGEWIGVNGESLDFLRHFFKEKFCWDVEHNEACKAVYVGIGSAERYNQGDAYFARELFGVNEEAVKTLVGEAPEPILTSIAQAMADTGTMPISEGLATEPKGDTP